MLGGGLLKANRLVFGPRGCCIALIMLASYCGSAAVEYCPLAFAGADGNCEFGSYGGGAPVGALVALSPLESSISYVAVDRTVSSPAVDLNIGLCISFARSIFRRLSGKKVSKKTRPPSRLWP